MGFPLKVEPLEVTLEVHHYRNRRMWIGRGPTPKRYIGSVEWFRRSVLRMRPRWRLVQLGEFRPLVPSAPRGRVRRVISWLFGEEP